MRTFNSVTSFLTKLGSLGLFWWGLTAFSKVFDYGIFTSVVAFKGPIVGGAIMFTAAFILDLALIMIYKFYGKDIFGFNTIIGWKEYKGESGLKRLRGLLFNASDPVVWLVISVTSNPFLATAYVRKTDKASPNMSKKDWFVFIPSCIVSYTFWILVSDRFAPVTKAVWQSIVQFFTLQA